jgi:ferritin-like protein
MGKAGNALIQNIELQYLTDALDRYYCYYMRTLHWSKAVLSRLEGQAAFTLPKELEELGQQCLANTNEIARRIGELGGTVTGDLTKFVERSGAGEFKLPRSNSNIGEILSYALAQTRTIIEAYGECLARTRGKDELTHQLVLKLLRHEVTRETELEAALAA